MGKSVACNAEVVKLCKNHVQSMHYCTKSVVNEQLWVTTLLCNGSNTAGVYMVKPRIACSNVLLRNIHIGGYLIEM